MEADREARRKFYSFYPDAGPLARSHYGKHLEFFRLGLVHEERGFLGGNRTGKTFCAGYEDTCHLTGRYPKWWEGFRFERPVVGWAAGVDVKALRESLQPTLFGRIDELGTGTIPGDDLLGVTFQRGASEAIDSASIRHVSGGKSRIVLKSYEQGRESFQGAKVDFIHLDEEPPMPVYTEALTRVMSTVPGEPNGRLYASFTPLLGISDVVLSFLGPEWTPGARLQ